MRPRRRPALVALGLALAAAGGVLTAALVANAGGRVAVLAVARDVPIGTVITRADLTIARVSPDASLTPVLARDEAGVVGQLAAVELRPGSFLVGGDVTSTTLPAVGQELIGVAVKPGQLPARPLTAGARVLVVGTPGDFSGSGSAGEVTSPGGLPTIAATVVDVGPPASDGTVVVDLSVASAQGPELAAMASTGHIALLVQPAGG
ncbi:MAG: SAF domain-containing protein [Mycobacteriales bacterium]